MCIHERIVSCVWSFEGRYCVTYTGCIHERDTGDCCHNFSRQRHALGVSASVPFDSVKVSMDLDLEAELLILLLVMKHH